MQRLISKDFPALEPLFEREVPNHTMLFSAIHGRTPGVALVDQWPSPNHCALRTNMGPTFFGGKPNRDFVHSAIEDLRRQGRLLIPLVSEEELSKTPYPSADNTIQRLAFSRWDPDAAAESLKKRQIPADCSLERMSQKLLAKCLWRPQILTMCGSIKAFLEHGFGFCLIRGSDILVEAYAVFWVVGVVEIGAITQEPCRNKGYAALTTFHLGKECQRMGHEIYWTCDRHNLASAAVARKLGFREETSYVWLEYGE